MTLSVLNRLFSHSLAVITLAMLCAFILAPQARAESNSHIVSNRALQQQMQSQSATRQKNIGTVTKFFSTPLAQRAMKMEHIDPSQVKHAIPTLSNSELANLSRRANEANQQFAAGNLSTRQMLLLIIILLIVVILVAVH